MSDSFNYDVNSDERKMEPLKINQEAVKNLIEVTKMWANLTQFENDLENYEKLKQELL